MQPAKAERDRAQLTCLPNEEKNPSTPNTPSTPGIPSISSTSEPLEPSAPKRSVVTLSWLGLVGLIWLGSPVTQQRNDRPAVAHWTTERAISTDTVAAETTQCAKPIVHRSRP